MRSWPDVSTGRRTRPSFWTSLQDAVDEIEGGEVSLPLAGIEDALGEYEPLVNMRAGIANVLDYGAVGDGVADDTAPILAAVATGRQTIRFPPVGANGATYKVTSSLTPLTNQTWIGSPGFQQTTTANPARVRISGAFDGPVIAATSVPSVTISGLHISGASDSALRNNVGINTTNCDRWIIRNNVIFGFGGQGISISGGVALRLEHNYTYNCVMGTTGHTDWVGAVELYCSDPYVAFNEFSSVPGGHVYDTGYIAALVAGSNNGFFIANMLELSEAGIAVTGGYNTFIGNRCDLNKGHGWVVVGGANRFVGNWSHRNGQGTTNTYDGFSVQSTAQGNLFSSNQVTRNIGNQMRYGFASAAAFVHSAQNTFIGNTVQYQAALTGEYNLTPTEGAAQFYGAKLIAPGGIGVGNSAAATTLGTVTKKIEVFDAAGASLGFVPVYGSIT